MRPPDGYSVRPATEDDIDAIDALGQAYDFWELGQADSFREQLVDDFHTSGFDPARDTWYVTDADADLAAFVLYKDRQPGEEGSQGFGRVHPQHHGRGLGAFLVDAVDRRWLEADAPRQDLLRHWLNAGDRSAAALLGSRGYQLVRRKFHLERSLAELQAAVVPPGIEVRPIRAGEERTLHRVNEESFAEHWGFSPAAFDEWRTMFAALFEAEMVWVADEAGELVGELLLQVQGDRGWVEMLGVMPGRQGRGIGRALLRTGFAELAGHGCRQVLLGVDAGNESGALRLYQSEGMTVRREWHVVEKRLG